MFPGASGSIKLENKEGLLYSNDRTIVLSLIFLKQGKSVAINYQTSEACIFTLSLVDILFKY